MLYRVFDAAELPALVSAFMDGYEVVAPVKRGAHYSFEAISSPDEMDLAYDTTLASPKRYFLPPTETLMRYNAATNEVADFQEEVVPRVIFGAHACDINAINRLDLVFRDGRYPDPYYKARRAATLIVGVSCSPDSDCFCNLWDADEARFGYDLFLHRLGDKFLVSISSVEAANILESAVDLRDATNEDRIEFRHATRARQAAFNPEIPEIQDVAMLMDAFHSDPFWEELGSKLPGLQRLRRRLPDVLLLRYPGRARPRRPNRRTSANLGCVHLAAVRRGGRRAQLPRPRAASACAIACTTSSTAFWQPMTACCAWAADAA